MSGVTNVVPAYRLRQEDLEKYLRDKFPDHADFDVKLARDQYNFSVPRLLSRTEIEDISKLRQPAKRRQELQSQIWASTIPLHITHSSNSTPYLIAVPRISYLPLLLPRLTTFFGPASSFSYQDILLKNLPVGLLYDLYQPQLPWRLELGDGPLFDIHDTYINSVKEADFIRNGTAKGIMSMSKENSTQLWNSVQDNDLPTFLKVHNLLLSPPTPLKHIPLRIYIPSTPPSTHSPSDYGSFKIVQTLIPPQTQNRETQTLGSALNTLLPSLFPSRRDAILAEPILHGATVPFGAPLEELMREAAYADGWLHLSLVMIDA